MGQITLSLIKKWLWIFYTYWRNIAAEAETIGDFDLTPKTNNHPKKWEWRRFWGYGRIKVHLRAKSCLRLIFPKRKIIFFFKLNSCVVLIRMVSQFARVSALLQEICNLINLKNYESERRNIEIVFPQYETLLLLRPSSNGTFNFSIGSATI